MAREFACSVAGCREVWRKFISVHLFHYFWVNGAPCFESPMTPLSDTHARARKLKDVIDKRVRARVSKKIALPVPMSRKVFVGLFLANFFITFSLLVSGVLFESFGYQNGPKLIQNVTQKHHSFEICFLHAPDVKNTSFWDPRTLKFMLLA